MKRIAKYINPTSGDVLYSSYPADVKEIDGVPFISMSYAKTLNRPFLYRQDAVKLERVEEVK